MFVFVLAMAASTIDNSWLYAVVARVSLPTLLVAGSNRQLLVVMLLIVSDRRHVIKLQQRTALLG